MIAHGAVDTLLSINFQSLLTFTLEKNAAWFYFGRPCEVFGGGLT